jgi:cell division protein FtsZ
VEAAQAAMASPLLEAGAIDGARGILINITGSSSLKLSEVNEASSLIQSAAHEDANIIFGAVLDEKMGDEVKITVIATGFRDQMPERRARMLSIGEVVMVEEPVVSVPVVARQAGCAPGGCKGQPPRSVPEPDGRRRGCRREESEEARSSLLLRTLHRNGNAGAAAHAMQSHQFPTDEFGSGFGSREPELVAAAARPQFAEMAEEPVYTPLPGITLPTSWAGVRRTRKLKSIELNRSRRSFPDAEEETHRDLDTPTFLRRLRF